MGCRRRAGALRIGVGVGGGDCAERPDETQECQHHGRDDGAGRHPLPFPALESLRPAGREDGRGQRDDEGRHAGGPRLVHVGDDRVPQPVEGRRPAQGDEEEQHGDPGDPFH